MQELVEILRDGLHRHRQKLPSLTLRSLERTSQVPRKFFAQLERGDAACEKNFPLLFDSLNYLRKHEEFDEEGEKKISSLLKKMFPNYVFEAGQNGSYPTSIYDRLAFLIQIRASHHCGVTREEIFATLGESAAPVLEEMLAKEQLIESEGAVYLAGKKDYLLPLEGVKFHQKTLADLVRKQRSRFNHSHIVSEKLTPEASEQLSQLYYELYQKAHAIVSDPKNHGDLPFFGFGSCDLFSYKGVLDENGK